MTDDDNAPVAMGPTEAKELMRDLWQGHGLRDYWENGGTAAEIMAAARTRVTEDQEDAVLPQFADIGRSDAARAGRAEWQRLRPRRSRKAKSP